MKDWLELFGLFIIGGMGIVLGSYIMATAINKIQSAIQNKYANKED